MDQSRVVLRPFAQCERLSVGERCPCKRRRVAKRAREIGRANNALLVCGGVTGLLMCLTQAQQQLTPQTFVAGSRSFKPPASKGQQTRRRFVSKSRPDGCERAQVEQD